MITGYFSGGSPFVRAWVGGLGPPREEPTPFLLDTGADTTTIAPEDGRALGVDYSSITDWRTSMRGIGGSARSAPRRVWLHFREDDGTIRRYQLEVALLEDASGSEWVPSLLGQDVLRRWRTVHDPAVGALHARVRTADATARVRG